MTIYYFKDTNRFEYRHVLKQGTHMTPDEMEHMKSFGCYDFYVNKYITEVGTVLDEVCYSINRDVLEQGMTEEERELINHAIENNMDETNNYFEDDDTHVSVADLRAERDEWKMKYEAAAVHASRLRAYNESLVPLIEAAQELENSYHDIYVVNKVRQASKNIRETWEDTRARCS